MSVTLSGEGASSGRHAQTYNTRVQSKVRSLANLAAASATCQPAAAARRSQGYTERGTTSGHTLVLPGPGLYTTSGHSRLGMLTLNIHRQHSARTRILCTACRPAYWSHRTRRPSGTLALRSGRVDRTLFRKAGTMPCMQGQVVARLTQDR
jgi:hypothetical protein